MPILVRPVREQLEHDRIIRLLQERYQRKHDPVLNVGHEPATSIVIGTAEFVPDVILVTNDKARKLDGVVEVETGESVNSLEALAQWAPFSRLRVPFHLYVPPSSLDNVRRLCRDHNVTVAELWTYHTNLDQVRFTLVQKAPDAAIAAAKRAGLSGAPKLKAPPQPPPPPPPPPPLPAAPARSLEAKAPARTAAQKASFGKFVAAAKASAAKHAAASPLPVSKPSTKAAAAPAPGAAAAKSAVTAAPAKGKAAAVSAKPGPAKPGPSKAAAPKSAPPKAVAAKPAAPPAKVAAPPRAAGKLAAKAAPPAAKAAPKAAPVKAAASKAPAPAKAGKPSAKASVRTVAKSAAKKAGPKSSTARPTAGKRR